MVFYCFDIVLSIVRSDLTSLYREKCIVGKKSSWDSDVAMKLGFFKGQPGISIRLQLRRSA